jgi:glycosyltransferase involved in cell wall biosynthesis
LAQTTQNNDFLELIGVDRVFNQNINLDLVGFDVVIPTKNSASTITECIKALFSSDVPVNRVLVIDKSQDNTPELVREMGYICIESEANYSQALRLGASLCETPYFMILDSDILLHRKFFSKLRRHIKDNVVSKGTFYDNIRWKSMAKIILKGRQKKIGALDAAFLNRTVFLELTSEWANGTIDAGGDRQLFRKCSDRGLPTYQNPNLINLHLIDHHRRYPKQTYWYGKSARRSRIHHWTVFPLRFLTCIVRGIRYALKERDLNFIPFYIHQGWNYFYGWLRG